MPLRRSDPHAFIIGAGFSRAISREMPLLRDLLSPARNAIKRRSPKLLAEVEKLGEDIEQWMSYLAQPLPWLDESSTLYNRSVFVRLAGTIATTIIDAQNIAVEEDCPPWLLTLVEAWDERRASVISLNYDTLIEKAYYEKTGNMARVLYQIPVPSVATRYGEASWAGDNIDSIRLFKLHGSVNWYHGGSLAHDQSVFDAELEKAWSPDVKAALGRRIAGLVPLVVPPVATKDTYYASDRLREQWRLAGREIDRARLISLVGYSLPPTDQMMRWVLATARQLKSVYVVNVDETVVDAATAVFGASRVVSTFAGSPAAVKAFSAAYAAGDVP